jgi:hypothetical protein
MAEPVGEASPTYPCTSPEPRRPRGAQQQSERKELWGWASAIRMTWGGWVQRRSTTHRPPPPVHFPGHVPAPAGCVPSRGARLSTTAPVRRGQHHLPTTTRGHAPRDRPCQEVAGVRDGPTVRSHSKRRGCRDARGRKRGKSTCHSSRDMRVCRLPQDPTGDQQRRQGTNGSVWGSNW